MIANSKKRLTIVLTLVAMLGCSAAFADRSATWIEPGISPDGSGLLLQLKHFKSRKGYTVGFFSRNLKDPRQDLLDSATNQEVEPRHNVIMAMRSWSLYGKYWHTDISLGLAYVSGEFKDNCDFRDNGEFCDIPETNTLGIPIQLSYSLGKYLGGGFSFTLVLTDDQPAGMISVSLPIGRFPQ